MIHKYHNFRLEYTLALPNYPPPPAKLKELAITERVSNMGDSWADQRGRRDNLSILASLKSCYKQLAAVSR